MRLALFTAALLASAAAPALATVPPVDLAGGELAVRLGLPAVGADVSLGRVTLGATAFGGVAPAVWGYGFVAHGAWRLTGLPRRETCVGVAVSGGALSASLATGAGETWFVQPAIVLAVPLGAAVSFRIAGGPVMFVTSWRGGGAGGQSQGFFPFVPNLELAIRLDEGSELMLGGLPNLLGWRGTF